MRGVVANILYMNFVAGVSFYCASAAFFLIPKFWGLNIIEEKCCRMIVGQPRLEISFIKGNQEGYIMLPAFAEYVLTNSSSLSSVGSKNGILFSFRYLVYLHF